MSNNLSNYVGKPVMRGRPFLILFYILLIPVFGLGLIMLVWLYLEIKTTKVNISDNEVELIHGLLNKQNATVPVREIRTSIVNQSFVGRLLNVGSVEIYAAGDQPEMVLRGFSNPSELRNQVRQIQNG